MKTRCLSLNDNKYFIEESLLLTNHQQRAIDFGYQPSACHKKKWRVHEQPKKPLPKTKKVTKYAQTGLCPGSVAADQETWGGAQLAQHRPGYVGEGLAGWDILVPSHPSDSCGGPGAVQADMVARCTVFPPKHWGRLPSGLSEHCVNKHCGLVGLCFGGRTGSRPLPLPRPYRSCSNRTRLNTNRIPQNWGEKGVR